MRIAIVCPYYPFPPSVGGVETIVRNVSTELARRGHEIHVVTTPFDVTTNKQVSDYGVEERGGVIVHKLKPGRLRVGYARFLKGLRGVIEEIKPEIVHSHSLHPHTLQLADWKNELSYKLVVELHHPIVSLEKISAKIAFPFAFYLLKIRKYNIDIFVAHTDLERKWLTDRGIPEEKVYVIRFPAIPSQLLNYQFNSKCMDDDYILFVGRVTWVKGVDTLIKAFKYIKNIEPKLRLKIVGPVNQRYKEYLIKLLKRLGLESSIDFLGPLYDEEKNYLIRCSKALVLPSLKEYTPGVLLEAQALGVPVIASRVGAIPEIVKEGETGILVPPGDAEALAEALERVLTNEELRSTMSLKAREWAKRFSLAKAATELEQLYYELLVAGD